MQHDSQKKEGGRGGEMICCFYQNKVPLNYENGENKQMS